MSAVFYTQRSPLGGWFPVSIHLTFEYAGRTYHIVKLREAPPPAIFDVREPGQLRHIHEIPLSEFVYPPEPPPSPHAAVHAEVGSAETAAMAAIASADLEAK